MQSLLVIVQCTSVTKKDGNKDKKLFIKGSDVGMLHAHLHVGIDPVIKAVG